MGSQTPNPADLPPASAPTLVLTNPTEAERQQTWTRNHAEWGGALSLQEYLAREPYLTTIPLAADGGITHWILTDSSNSSSTAGERPVLASCESLRKRVLVASPGSEGSEKAAGEVKDGIAYGVGSVYTYPEHRGRGYAARMLSDLGTFLRTYQASDRGGEEAVASALWSDIGKVFYARMGWAVFPSMHVAFRVSASASTPSTPTVEANGGTIKPTAITPITYANLPAFCAADEALLRGKLSAAAAESGRTSVAFAPDHNALRWHLFRDDFITGKLFPARARSEIKGAAAGVEGRRVWAVWARNYHRDVDVVDKNTLYILRVAVEDEKAAGEGGEEATAAFAAVMRTALREAESWRLGKVDLWNPSPVVRGLIERSGLAHQWVDRDVNSIPSMMWYGKEDSSEINWVANEKFCWF
ncbi:hypothetical protein F5B20DRAFT_180512 [Whalleya microplaca]|nr:hypothetical protein F5B20DRAFT_180512 [Whalleya microplaca]